MRRLLTFFALLFGLLSAPAVLAQDVANLVSDKLEISGDNTLTATGHVQVFYQGRQLSANAIVYDSVNDRLIITGPIVLTEGKDSYVLADQANLSADLTEGVLISARLVLAQQLQLAAAEMHRVDGRFTALTQVVASSCQVCKGNPTPLWEMRAKRVVHDIVEKQLYFDNAQVRVAGVPVFYVPRLRLPDPSLKRATGFLIPSLRNTSIIGTGLRLPYFIVLGESRDLLVTPFFTTRGSRTVDLRYRQAFRTGYLEITGAVTDDQLLPGELRGYALATGSFALPGDFRLDLRGKVVSDAAYLLDYGYPTETDRLDSRIEVSRVRRAELISGRLIGLHSIRVGEENSSLPAFVADFTWRKRISPSLIGGVGGLQFQTHAHYRSSGDPVTDADSDGIIDGRDVQRASFSGDWRRNLLLPNGMELALLGEAAADFYVIGQDVIYAGSNSRLHGAAAVELRWPWVKSHTNGVSQTIEPVLQLVVASEAKSSIPNEDSALVEFDEGNLFALSRFPGADATEDGIFANFGVNYLRSDPNGWTLGATLGRVVRAKDLGQFSTGSGLDGVRSDWLAAWQLTAPGGVQLSNRLLFDDRFEMTKAELQASYAQEKFSATAGYIHTVADPLENRLAPISELTLGSTLNFAPNWTALASSRYDFEADRAANAGLGLTFRNECLLVDLSLSRRFTSSTSVKATTEFGLKVELLGFGGSSAPGPARQCRR